jgi:hypothetical protein
MVSNSEHLPEDGQVGPKHLAIYVILMLFKIKERLQTVSSCVKDKGE